MTHNILLEWSQNQEIETLFPLLQKVHNFDAF